MENMRRVLQALVPKKKKWKKCICTEALEIYGLQVAIILLTNDTSFTKSICTLSKGSFCPLLQLNVVLGESN